MARKSVDLRGLFALAACILCWGAVPVLLRQLTTDINAWTSNGIRYPLAAACYWPVLVVAYRRGHLTKELMRRAALPSFFAFTGQVFWGLAPYYLTASAIGFYIRFAMVPALIGAMILFPDERRLLGRLGFYVGLVMVIAGFLGFSLFQGITHNQTTWTGVVMMLCCAFFFGWYGVSVRACLGDIHPVLGFAVVCQFVSIGTFAGLLIQGDPESLRDLDLTGWSRVMGSTVLGIALGHIFMYGSVQRLGATITSAVQTLTPFVTALLAAWVLGESMNSWQWLAGITMVIGAGVLILTEHRLRRLVPS